MFKWKPHNEQYICERRLIKVMKRLKIEQYNFNWDRTSCFIEIQYQEHSYRIEHSLQKAKEKGIVMLRTGLDCLVQLVESLEDLSRIIDRGTYRLETWISSLKLLPENETPEFSEEVHIRYKSLGKRLPPIDNRNEEFVLAAPETSLEEFEPHQFTQRPKWK